MNNTILEVISVTFLLVLTFLVLQNADKFATAINSIAGGYATSVKTLQGR
jgi:hypothetical protein